MVGTFSRKINILAGDTLMQALDDLDPGTAEDALVTLAGHVPPDVPIGRPITCGRGDDGAIVFVVAGMSMWVSERAVAYRFVPIDDCYEVTEYRRGREYSRNLMTVD